jgi:hypothetical protein
MPEIKINPQTEKKIIEEYKNEKIVTDIAINFGCHHMTIRRHLKGKVRFRPLGEDVSKAKTKNWDFSKKQEDILEGLLLGDGCITGYKTRERRKFFVLANNSKEFCLHTKNLMPEGHFNLVPNSKDSFHLVGKGCNFIKRLHKEWYKNEKIVPQNLILNKTKLYYWYLCDGTIRNQKGRRSNINLYTDGLHLMYVKILSNGLREMGFQNNIFKHNYATKKENYGFAIRISAYSTKEFLSFIGKNEVKYYEYKWNYQTI